MPLTATDRDQGIHDFQSGLQRCPHRCSLHDAGGIPLARHPFELFEWSAIIQGATDGIDHSSDQFFADRSIENAPCPLYAHPGLDLLPFIEQYAADAVSLQIEDESSLVAFKPEDLIGEYVRQPLHLGNPPFDLRHDSGFPQANLGLLPGGSPRKGFKGVA